MVFNITVKWQDDMTRNAKR